jgi:MoaA/NifB/PqqE/SkfB family radical SAM enzyme
MLSSRARTILSNFLKGKHTTGQMYNLIKYLLGKKNTVLNWDPIYVSVFLTYSCNLSCDMCLTHSTKHDNLFGQKPCKDVDFATFKQILDKYKNALAVNLIGNGEPLLHKDFFKMIEYAAQRKKMYIYSSSNGIFVGKYAKQIISSSLSRITISINGHNADEFNRMTGMSPNFFEVIRENISELVAQRDLKKAKIEIWISIILDQINYVYLQDMINFAESLGIDGVFFFQYLPSPAIGFTAEERCLFSDDIKALETFSHLMPSRSKIKIIFPPLLERKGNNNKICSTYFYLISVDGEGNIGGCCAQLLDLSKNGTFYEKDAWNNHHFKDMRRRFIEPETPILEPCKWCYNNSSFLIPTYQGSNRVSNLLNEWKIRLSHKMP